MAFGRLVKSDVRNVVLSPHHLALLALDEERPDRADALAAESHALFERAGDREMAAYSLIARGEAAAAHGDLAGAAALYERAHAVCRGLEAPARPLAHLLLARGRLALLAGDDEREDTAPRLQCIHLAPP